MAEAKEKAQYYLLDDGLLMRKWVPCFEDCVGNPVYQIVVPVQFCKLVLQLSHDQSGHIGVRKTYDCTLRPFFWPRSRKDVSEYIKTFHTCQVTKRMNQTVKPVPLHPVPAIGETPEHIIIDCVGPLPPLGQQ